MIAVNYSLSHLSDAAVIREFPAAGQNDRAATAMLLAFIAEIDARRLYAPAGHRLCRPT